MVTRRSPWLIAAWLLLAVAIAACQACGTSPTGAGGGSASPVFDASTAPTSADDAGSALFAWWTGGAGAIFTTISSDESQIAAAASNEDVDGMQAGCQALQSDVEQAQAYTPAPDDVVQSSLTDALAMFARSATDCIAGTTTMSADLINQASEEMSQGTTKLEEATARVQSLNGN